MNTVPSPRWGFILRELARGRGRSAVLAAVHFLLKDSAARLFPIFVGALVGIAEARPEDWAWRVAFWTGLVSVFLLWNIPGHILCQRALSKLVRGYGHELRLMVCRQLQQLSLLYHGSQSEGRVHTKIVRDIDTIENGLNQSAHMIASAVVTLLFTIGTVAFTVPQAGLVFLVLAPLAVIVRVVFGRRMRERADDYRESAEALSARMQDMLQMMPLTRAHGLEETELRDAEGRIGDMRHNATRFDAMSAAFGASTWSTFMLFQVAFMVVMIWLVVRGWASIGEVVIFQGLFGQLSGSLMALANMVPLLAQVKSARRSVDEVLAAPDLEENRQGREPVDVRGAIELSGARYRYPGATEDALQGLTLSVEAGDSLAIVGPSGGGKSTLLSLMLGLLRPTGGSVVLDGQSVNELDMRAYRRRVAVVTQRSVFFGGTLHENITYGGTPDDDRRVQEALEMANATGFVSELPEGLATRIGAGGRALSGGQLQRLALARALVRDPRVLVLDEPTSALDAEAELAFRQAMRNVIPGRTVVLVSHALVNARLCARIAVVEGGRVVAIGSHEELSRGDNFYARTLERLAV